jgi:hypothetical protein
MRVATLTVGHRRVSPLIPGGLLELPTAETMELPLVLPATEALEPPAPMEPRQVLVDRESEQARLSVSREPQASQAQVTTVQPWASAPLAT